jgi:hypothetical protein
LLIAVFLLGLFFHTARWWQYVSPKRHWTSTSLRGVRFQKLALFSILYISLSHFWTHELFIVSLFVRLLLQHSQNNELGVFWRERQEKYLCKAHICCYVHMVKYELQKISDQHYSYWRCKCDLICDDGDDYGKGKGKGKDIPVTGRGGS